MPFSKKARDCFPLAIWPKVMYLVCPWSGESVIHLDFFWGGEVLKEKGWEKRGEEGEEGG